MPIYVIYVPLPLHRYLCLTLYLIFLIIAFVKVCQLYFFACSTVVSNRVLNSWYFCPLIHFSQQIFEYLGGTNPPSIYNTKYKNTVGMCSILMDGVLGTLRITYKHHLGEAGGMVKVTDCSYRGLRFNSQLTVDSQLSVIPVSGNLMHSSGLHGHCRHTIHRCKCRQMPVHIQLKNISKISC